MFRVSLVLLISNFAFSMDQNNNSFFNNMLSLHSTEKIHKKYNWGPDLFVAMLNDDIVESRRLIEAGAEVNFKDCYGNTALIIACYKNYIDIVKLLISEGADINFKNNLGQSALLIAFKKGFKDIVELLIQAGADIEVR